MIENWEKLNGKYSISHGTATVLTLNVTKAHKGTAYIINPNTSLPVHCWYAIVSLECNLSSKLKADRMFIRVTHNALDTSLEVSIDTPDPSVNTIAHFWIDHKNSDKLKTPNDFITWIFNDYANKTHHFVEW